MALLYTNLKAILSLLSLLLLFRGFFFFFILDNSIFISAKGWRNVFFLAFLGSPGIGRRVNHTHSLPGGADSPGMRPACSVPAFQVPDSSSNTSSCNSSTPSSPAFLTSSQLPPSPAPQPSPSIILNDDTQFQFPGKDHQHGHSLSVYCSVVYWLYRFHGYALGCISICSMAYSITPNVLFINRLAPG